jgi:hypothetical protein
LKLGWNQDSGAILREPKSRCQFSRREARHARFWYTHRMRWNPYLNAIGVAAYIWGVGFLIHYIGSLHHDTPDNLTGSIAALSLLVFSAAVMGFLFFYRPTVLLVEDKRDEAVFFFLKTLGTFGAITLLVILIVL